ncbi:TipAS antibiotic-recognition domain-containing protein [Actinoplanes sp. NEAU-A12]|uniref:TipAS antibiotic-recognition domain-containing protein n=1 Tax=Actinoplanes sandaracinus TaxID=3045177 RepID=A0ABT6WV71_9ACTN|nr:TipAS antibiotic-recognition domain-containing protein [Actinoplanes sandaracinus]MDI6103645.1 TipAS antibiotic-recognition domain-containing protein [Actinoplanes sandaracinus]
MSTPTMDHEFADRCRRSLADEQAASLAATGGWAHVDKDRVHSDWRELYGEIAAAMTGGARPEDETIQDLVGRHYAIACRFYTPSPDAYLGMALLYAEDDAMRDFHNAYHPQMVEFLGAAMRRYAETRL